MTSSLSKQGEDAAESLEPAEESLDLVAAAIERSVVFPRLQAGAPGRHDGNPSEIQSQLAVSDRPHRRRPSAVAAARAVVPDHRAARGPCWASCAWPGERAKVIAVRAFAATI